jgi:hypothetical protein
MDEKKFIEFYQRQKESGLTVKEFCSNEIIAPSTFYYWQKRLKNRNRLPDFIPVVVNPLPGLSQGNIPDNTITPSSQQINDSPHIEIEFPNRTIIRIRGEIDLAMLKTLIHLNG